MKHWKIAIALAPILLACNAFALDLSLVSNAHVSDDRAFKDSLASGDAPPDAIALDKALFTAVHRGYLESIDWLLAHGASPNYSDANGNTVLMANFLGFNFFPNQYVVTKRLLDLGADANVLNANQENALLVFFRTILPAPENNDPCGRPVEPPEHSSMVVHWKDQAKVEEFRTAPFGLLVANTANINSVDKAGNSAMIYAVQKNRFEFVLPLISAGANANAVDRKGRTALFSVPVELVAPLVAAGADVNWADSDGDTPLHHAMQAESTRRGKQLKQYVRALFAAGAKDTRNKRGYLASELGGPWSSACDLGRGASDNGKDARALIRKSTKNRR